MVEPRDFSEIYLDTANIKESFAHIHALCTQEFHNFRFNIEEVKKLSKYHEALKSVKQNIDKDLENIQSCFDNIETFVIVYLHNIDKVQKELVHISEERQKKINEAEKDKEDIKEDIEKITDYIEKF
jgi:DNA repair exonuclease SbcCD ATPase subunit